MSEEFNSENLTDKEKYIVGSFSYDNYEAYDKALKEQNKIVKLESQMDYNNPKVVFSVYCKVIDRNLFETLEGVSYLIHLQNYLYQNESFLSGPIPSIPSEILKNASILLNEAKETEVKPEGQESKEADNEATDAKESKEEEVKAKELEKANKASKLAKGKQKDSLVTYKIVIAFLILIIAVMMFIALRSDSPNIVNYRNKIQNEYVEWEEKLNDKEKELNKRERELKSLEETEESNQ